MLDSYIVTSPELMNPLFARAYNSGQIEHLLALYEPDACLVSESGEAVYGLEAIGASLSLLLQLRGTMISENQYTYRVGNIALLQARFHIVGTGFEGERIELRGVTAEVVRQQADGRWLYVIDHPLGGGSIPLSGNQDSLI
jgi:ketosteroid isomerase-like protein